MEVLIPLMLGIGMIVVLILIIRTFGAWMLRINEIIELQEEILRVLRSVNNNLMPKEEYRPSPEELAAKEMADERARGH